MAEVPKIVRARLAVKADGPHPDADLLTAFAEQNLAPRERDGVLTHLSQCAECREVAILALPQTEITVLQPSRSTRWLAWPALRWGALAACGVVVVAAVSLHERSSELKPMMARQESATVALKQNEAPSQERAAVAQSTLKDRDKLPSPSRTDSAKPGEIVTMPSPPVAKTMFATRAKRVPAPAAPPAKESQPVVADAKQPSDKPVDKVASEMDAAPAQVTSEAANIASPTQSLQNEAARASLGKAKDASELSSNAMARSSLAKQQAMAGAVPAAVNQFPYKKLTPRWTLSADGTLQRSLDAGKTWKTIPVSADATFTAVAAMDSDIWVGGTHGALYHSIDAGEHWTQVAPSSSGEPLTSNIIGIEFTDSLHGKISTASQETWATSDGGQSWQIVR